MALRDTLRANAAPHLESGEVIQSIFPAQNASPWWVLLSYWIIFFKNAYRVVIATDRRILVCRAGRFRITPVNEVTHVLPRSTRIGPPTGLWYKCDALGERMWIAKRYHKDVIAADETATAGAASNPAGWYPDPQESSLQRYWDGSQWTTNTAPR